MENCKRNKFDDFRPFFSDINCRLLYVKRTTVSDDICTFSTNHKDSSLNLLIYKPCHEKNIFRKTYSTHALTNSARARSGHCTRIDLFLTKTRTNYFERAAHALACACSYRRSWPNKAFLGHMPADIFFHESHQEL